jgi:general secretion pathway protein K
MATRPPSERGAALLSVLVSVAVLTAMAANLAYESRVSLRLAANARDELRAEYQARSGVALSRLVLSFQQQIDGAMTGPAAAPGGLSMPRVQLWRAIPVDSMIVESLFGGGGPPPAQPAGDATPRPAAAASGPGAGASARAPSVGPANVRTAAATTPQLATDRPAPPEGGPRLAGGAPSFDARIEDEATKVNAQLDVLILGSGGGVVAAQLLALYQLTCDPRWDPLFDREDANGYKGSRADLLVKLREWVDGDAQSSGIKADFPATCSMTPLPPYFERAFGDKNASYDRGATDERYRVKNAHMDSLDELYLVAGVSDAFMAAFGDRLTVYLPRDAKQNVNDLGAASILQKARSIAFPPLQPALVDPTKFVEVVQKLLQEQSLLGYLSITPQQFVQAVQAAGVTVSPDAAKAFTDRSDTYSIRSTGAAGDVKTTIEAIVRLDPQQQTQLQAAAQGQGAPGRVIHWREE